MATLAVSGGCRVGSSSAMNGGRCPCSNLDKVKVNARSFVMGTGTYALWNRDFILSWGLNGPEMKIEYRLPTRF
jgi:hypothetical protein